MNNMESISKSVFYVFMAKLSKFAKPVICSVRYLTQQDKNELLKWLCLGKGAGVLCSQRRSLRHANEPHFNS